MRLKLLILICFLSLHSKTFSQEIDWKISYQETPKEVTYSIEKDIAQDRVVRFRKKNKLKATNSKFSVIEIYQLSTGKLTHTTSLAKLKPNATTEIDFKSFNIIENNLHTLFRIKIGKGKYDVFYGILDIYNGEKVGQIHKIGSFQVGKGERFVGGWHYYSQILLTSKDKSKIAVLMTDSPQHVMSKSKDYPTCKIFIFDTKTNILLWNKTVNHEKDTRGKIQFPAKTILRNNGDLFFTTIRLKKDEMELWKVNKNQLWKEKLPLEKWIESYSIIEKGQKISITGLQYKSKSRTIFNVSYDVNTLKNTHLSLKKLDQELSKKIALCSRMIDLEDGSHILIWEMIAYNKNDEYKAYPQSKNLLSSWINSNGDITKTISIRDKSKPRTSNSPNLFTTIQDQNTLYLLVQNGKNLSAVQLNSEEEISQVKNIGKHSYIGLFSDYDKKSFIVESRGAINSNISKDKARIGIFHFKPENYTWE